MARSVTNVKVEENKSEIVQRTTNVNTQVNSVNDNRPGNKYALDITCICGGRYYPFTHRISDKYVDGITYRCSKCGKDINVKLTPVK